MDPILFKQIPLFASLSTQQVTRLLAHSHRHTYARGSRLVEEGEQTNKLYVILSGNVKVSKHDAEGREVILAKIGPNGFFGEMNLFDKRACSGSVETLERCDILHVSHSDFMTCFKDNFDLATVIICELIDRLREADRKIGSLALLDVPGRVAQFFLDQAQEISGLWVVQSVSPKQEIAKTVGASREMVTRVIKEFMDRGYIRYEKREVVLLDRVTLKAVTQAKSSGTAEKGELLLQRPRKQKSVDPSISHKSGGGTRVDRWVSKTMGPGH